MSFEFFATTLGDFLTFSNGKSSPVRCDNGKIVVFGANGEIGRCNETNSQSNSIIVGRVGSYCGAVHFSKSPCWITDNAIKAVVKNGNDPFFAYCLLKQLNLNNWRSGSGQPLINQSTLNSILVTIPPPREQKAIGYLASTIDYRISLLRETNTTLEAIAHTLFKSWFVDFDPVKAKADGRLPDGMSDATAALFPSEFEESALGLIPKGWEFGTVESFAEKVGMGPFGSNIKVETFVDRGIPVISGQHLKNTLVEDTTYNFITEQHAKKLANSCVRHGDVIFTHAGSIGQVSLLHKHARFERYILSQRQFFLRCDLEKMRPEWIVYYFRSVYGQHQLLANTSQVGVPSIARPVSYLRSIKVLLPTIEIIDRFANIVDVIHQNVLLNRERINVIINIRDTLLPRLISGKLRLNQAQEIMDEVGA